MIWNVTHHHAVIDPQVVIAALSAAAFLYARFKVTPVADPKDGNGQPLTSAAMPVITVNTTGGAMSTTPMPRPEKTLLPPAAPE